MALNPPRNLRNAKGKLVAYLVKETAGVSVERAPRVDSPKNAWVPLKTVKKAKPGDGVELCDLPPGDYAVRARTIDKRGVVSGPSEAMAVKVAAVIKSSPVTPPVDPPPIDVGETPGIPITSLAQANEPGKKYRLTADTLVGSSAALRTPNVWIDFGTTSIRSTSPVRYLKMFQAAAPHIRLSGGVWRLGVLQLMVGIDAAATDFTLEGGTLAPILKPDGSVDGRRYEGGNLIDTQPWGACELFGQEVRPTFRNLVLPIPQKYLVYGGARDLTVEGCTVSDSVGEVPIRLTGLSGDCVIRNNSFSRGIKGSGRYHDGNGLTSLLIENNYMRGDSQLGPMAEGQGGQLIGFSEWYNAQGRKVDTKAQADLAKTAQIRAATLGKRLNGTVLFKNNTLIGDFNVRAGVPNRIRVEGGTSQPLPEFATKTDWQGQTLNGIKQTYPEPEWRLAGDVMRPPTMVDFIGHAFTGTRIGGLIKPAGWTFSACTYNGGPA